MDVHPLKRIPALLGMRSLWFLLPIFGGATTFLVILSVATANTTLFAADYPRLLMGGHRGLAVDGVDCLSIGHALSQMATAGIRLETDLQTGIVAGGHGRPARNLGLWRIRSFLSSSIESWFDVNVDKALTAGLGLGRTAFDSLLDDLVHKATTMSSVLADATALDEFSLLQQLREQFGVQEATLLSKNGTVLAFSSARNDALIPEGLTLTGNISHQIRAQRPYRMVENLPGKGVFLRVLVPVNRISFTEDFRILQLLQPVSKELASNADQVEAAWRGYQELLLARHGLKICTD